MLEEKIFLDDEIGEASENYLEAILRLEDESKKVRSVDVANALDVSRPSVNKAIKNLKKAGLVDQEHYGSITLTPKGREIAERISGTHKIFKTFLVDILGISEDTADKDACKMEHDVSYETMCRLKEFVISYKKSQKVI